MHLSRIVIENFLNFQSLDVALGGNLVIVGENRVRKSNLLYALRFIFDPSLPDSSRQLGLADSPGRATRSILSTAKISRRGS